MRHTKQKRHRTGTHIWDDGKNLDMFTLKEVGPEWHEAQSLKGLPNQEYWTKKAVNPSYGKTNLSQAM